MFEAINCFYWVATFDSSTLPSHFVTTCCERESREKEGYMNGRDDTAIAGNQGRMAAGSSEREEKAPPPLMKTWSYYDTNESRYSITAAGRKPLRVGISQYITVPLAPIAVYHQHEWIGGEVLLWGEMLHYMTGRHWGECRMCAFCISGGESGLMSATSKQKTKDRN